MSDCPPQLHACQRLTGNRILQFQSLLPDRQTTSTVPQVTTARYAGLVAKKRLCKKNEPLR